MPSDFDFLHIRRHTVGSSNELSFDVLDLKSEEANGKSQGPFTPTPVSPVQGRHHDGAQPSTLSEQDEVARRKKARQRHRLRLQVLSVVLVVVFVGVAAYFGVRLYGEKVDFSEAYASLVDRLSSVDDMLVDADRLIGNVFSADDSAERQRVAAAVPELTTELARIRAEADSLKSRSRSEEDTDAANRLIEASQARSDMLAAANGAFRVSAAAAEEADIANAAWNNVLGADQLAREAAQDANKATTEAATREALEKTRKARQQFADAREALQGVTGRCNADFATQLAYLDKKAEALDSAIATGEALLAGNRDAANEANDAYNRADEEAAKLAETLPASVEGAIEKAYSEEAADHQRKYDDARSRAISSDSHIRRYLNT